MPLHALQVFFPDPGKRIFTLVVEDTIIENIDPFVIGGGKNKAFTLVVPGIVDDGFVNIESINKVNNAKLSGIEIILSEIHTAHAVSQGPVSHLYLCDCLVKKNSGRSHTQNIA